MTTSPYGVPARVFDEQTVYWVYVHEPWGLEVVRRPLDLSADAGAFEFRAYVRNDDRRVHKTPWYLTEEEAEGHANALIEVEMEKAARPSWWRRLWRRVWS
jgi:hypothetical protein